MSYPPFSNHHVGDNVQTSRSLNPDGVCIFQIPTQRLNILEELNAPLIFDIEILGERHVYYAQADDLKMAFGYFKLISSQDTSRYLIGINPRNGQVHSTDFSRSHYPKEKVLFTLLPMTDILYEKQFLKTNTLQKGYVNTQTKRAKESLLSSCGDASFELYRVLSQDKTSPELKLLRYVRLLVAAGANVNTAYGPKQQTVLHEAASVNRVLVLNFLLSQNADKEAINIQGMTPLANAVHMGVEENVCCLLLNGADPDARDNLNNPVIFHTLSDNYENNEDRKAIIKLLMEWETTIAADTCNMRQKLQQYMDISEWISIVMDYCLPLHDMILLYQSIPKDQQNLRQTFSHKISTDWNNSRANLYRRIWEEGNVELLENMLKGDAVLLHSGKIIFSNEPIRKFRIEGRNLLEALRLDIRYGRAEERISNILNLYFK